MRRTSAELQAAARPSVAALRSRAAGLPLNPRAIYLELLLLLLLVMESVLALLLLRRFITSTSRAPLGGFK